MTSNSDNEKVSDMAPSVQLNGGRVLPHKWDTGDEDPLLDVCSDLRNDQFESKSGGVVKTARSPWKICLRSVNLGQDADTFSH